MKILNKETAADFLFDLRIEATSEGFEKLAKYTGLSREGLYKILSVNGNPKLSVLMNILEYFNLEISIVSSTHTASKVPEKTRKNSLLSKFPCLENYFDNEKNNELSLNDLTVSSRKLIFWKCPHCNEWWQETPIGLMRRVKDIINNLTSFKEGSFAELVKSICVSCKKGMR